MINVTSRRVKEFHPSDKLKSACMTMCYFRLFTPNCYSNFSKILFSHLHNIYQIQMYLAIASTKVHKLDLDLVSQPDICHIILLGYLFSIALDTARGRIDFCLMPFFQVHPLGTGVQQEDQTPLQKSILLVKKSALLCRQM